uniref:Uncharacterized protein n=1 Tax=Romanomermis culicivorax TaxID=13658 RepID=A0A915KTD4_ROMCU
MLLNIVREKQVKRVGEMYGNEPPISDTLSTYVFHLMSSAFACSSHQSVYFTLSLNFWAIHFGHYLFFSLILIGEKLIVKREFRGFKMLPWYQVSLLALSQFFVSSTTCLIHDNGSNGALYAQRVSDFAVTLVIIFVGKNFVDPKIGVPPRFRLLLRGFTR